LNLQGLSGLGDKDCWCFKAGGGWFGVGMGYLGWRGIALSIMDLMCTRFEPQPTGWFHFVYLLFAVQ
jgi:hypothetical protein